MHHGGKRNGLRLQWVKTLNKDFRLMVCSSHWQESGPPETRFAGKVSGVGAQPDPEAILTPPHSKTRFNEVAFTLSALLFVLFYSLSVFPKCW